MKNELLYGVEDRVPFKEAFLVAFQHILTLFVAVITPPLIIASAIGLDAETSGYIISMALFVAAIGTFMQCRGVGPIGTRQLCIQGTSFSFLSPLIAAGAAGGLPLIFGVCLAAAPVEMFVSRIFRHLTKIITPTVSGVVIMLIGLSLIKVSVISCGGGNSAIAAGTFGSMENIGIAASVLLTIIVFNNVGNKYLRMCSIFIGLAVGSVVAMALGMFHFDNLSSASLLSVNIPIPFRYGLDFEWTAFLSIALIFVVTSIEATGSITANCIVSGTSISGKDYMRRVSRGVLCDGTTSFISAIFNSYPCSVYSQHNGVVQLTAVASRRVGYMVAAMLLVLALFPVVGVFFTMIPDAVIGGATLLMFGTVAVAGLRVVASAPIDGRNSIIIGVSLALGLGVELYPDILSQMPDDIQRLFSSGITTGGVTAILANILIPRGKNN